MEDKIYSYVYGRVFVWRQDSYGTHWQVDHDQKYNNLTSSNWESFISAPNNWELL